jgi:CheY-like chemotaxis protein
MAGGGVITISARNVTPDNEVAISVQDTGAGIALDILGKIFDPFFTTKPIGKGTGLGLSQVHGFAHQAGGTVKVASELGKGTRITILLSRKEAAPRGERSQGDKRRRKRHRLLVEDNPEVATVSSGLLEQLGYTVRRVADAEAALREIELDGIDLVFSDIVMPGKMDGLGLARHLKAVRPGLPILLTSGYSDAALNVRGDFPILRKPYEIHELSPGDREAAAVTGPARLLAGALALLTRSPRTRCAAFRGGTQSRGSAPCSAARADRRAAARRQKPPPIRRKRPPGNAEHGGPMQAAAKLFGELCIGDRIGAVALTGPARSGVAIT